MPQKPGKKEASTRASSSRIAELEDENILVPFTILDTK
jgi:hypothetical protein